MDKDRQETSLSPVLRQNDDDCPHHDCAGCGTAGTVLQSGRLQSIAVHGNAGGYLYLHSPYFQHAIPSGVQDELADFCRGFDTFRMCLLSVGADRSGTPETEAQGRESHGRGKGSPSAGSGPGKAGAKDVSAAVWSDEDRGESGGIRSVSEYPRDLF